MVELDEIPLEESLVDAGIIDSFGLIEISSFLEREYNISVSEDQMTQENFGSVLKIAAFVQAEMNRK